MEARMAEPEPRSVLVSSKPVSFQLQLVLETCVLSGRLKGNPVESFEPAIDPESEAAFDERAWKEIKEGVAPLVAARSEQVQDAETAQLPEDRGKEGQG